MKEFREGKLSVGTIGSWLTSKERKLHKLGFGKNLFKFWCIILNSLINQKKQKKHFKSR